MSDPMIALVCVGLLSSACQYLAYKIRLPAILPLLVVGMLVGPILHLLDADALFGDLLFPVVSLSVAIILFEGALTLKFSDIAGHGNMVRNMCTIGVAITWVIATVTAHFALEISWQLAFLFGAIVTVTGPTVIVPMLRTVRPQTNIANILRWEGIVIDPIGALLAVLVYEYIVSSQSAMLHTAQAFALTLATGIGIGALVGYSLGVAIRKSWIPHYLENTAVLTIILAAFAFSNAIAHESGLLTVTIAGMMMANMKQVDVEDILEFKETLSVLLISGLFILLATRLDLNAIVDMGASAVIVLIALLFIARPLSVIASSVGTKLNWREIALLSWVAPRGIVAAAVSALFALQLEQIGFEQADVIVPMVFLVIIASVVLQSLTAKPIAKLLKVRAPSPTGFLIFGGSQFSRMLASEMQKQSLSVVIADTNWDAIRAARMKEIPVYFGNPMSEHASRHLDMTRLGTVLIMSPYRQLNPLVTYHFEYALGKGKVWGLTNNEQQTRPSHQVANEYADKLSLFDEGMTYGYLASAVSRGATIKTTRLSEEFSYSDYRETYGIRATLLIALDENQRIHVAVQGKQLQPKSGWKLISLIEVERDSNE